MSIHEDMDRAVLEFMAECGFTATYQSTTSAYSDVTGLTTTSIVSLPCQAILLEIDPRKYSGDSTQNNTLIRQGDKLMFLRPTEKADPLRLPLAINVASDSVLAGTKQYNIVTSKQTNPSTTNCVLYELYLRE